MLVQSLVPFDQAYIIDSTINVVCIGKFSYHATITASLTPDTKPTKLSE